MTSSQKDLYQNVSKVESMGSRAPVNLYGGKFYRRGAWAAQNQGERGSCRGKDSKEKKSGWTTLKKAIFTPLGTSGYSGERRHSRDRVKCLLTRKEEYCPMEEESTYEEIDEDKSSKRIVYYHDPSLSYLDPCPSYHRNVPLISPNMTRRAHLSYKLPSLPGPNELAPIACRHGTTFSERSYYGSAPSLTSTKIQHGNPLFLTNYETPHNFSTRAFYGQQFKPRSTTDIYDDDFQHKIKFY